MSVIKICNDYGKRLRTNITEKEFEVIADSVTVMKESLFFDMQIVCSDIIFPCHKYVLSLRSEVLRKELSEEINELNWTEMEPEVALKLLCWFYTDKVDFNCEHHALGLLQASFRFQLPTLFEACERILLILAEKKSYLPFLAIAVMVGANKLMEKCLEFKRTRFDDSLSELTGKSNQICNCSLSRSDECTSGRIDQTDIEFANEDRLVIAKAEMLKIVNGISRFVLRTRFKVFDDYNMMCPDHVHILSTRCGSNAILNSEEEYWIGTGTDSLIELSRWIYTNKIVFRSDKQIMSLLSISYKFQLTTLFKLCEKAAIMTVNIRSSSKLLHLANYTRSTRLLQSCRHLLFSYWNRSHLNDLNAYNIERDGEPWRVTRDSNKECDSSETTIMQLNDDCWFEIFNWISMTDLSSVKSTCRRLNELADRYFQTYGKKSLSIQSSNVFEDVWNLEHFGEFCHTLNILDDGMGYWSWDNILAMISDYCNTNLKQITLQFNTRSNVRDDSIALLEGILKNIEIIQFINLQNEGQIKLFFSFCENLKEVHVIGRRLELNNLFCENNYNIKRITMEHMSNDDMLEEISKNLLNLEYLSFTCMSSSFETGKINNLAQLEQLRELQIDCDSKNLALTISSIAKTDVLEYLSLLGVNLDTMNESFAIVLAQFTKLKELSLTEVYGISTNAVRILSKNLGNIEKLCFVSCLCISLDDITEIIENHSKLKELLIGFCTSIDYIDRANYLKLLKHRNLKILLESSVLSNTKLLLSDEFANFDQFSTLPEKWDRWEP